MSSDLVKRLRERALRYRAVKEATKERCDVEN